MKIRIGELQPGMIFTLNNRRLLLLEEFYNSADWLKRCAWTFDFVERKICPLEVTWRQIDELVEVIPNVLKEETGTSSRVEEMLAILRRGPWKEANTEALLYEVAQAVEFLLEKEMKR